MSAHLSATILGLCCIPALIGEGPVGAVSSKGPVNISGVRVDVAEVPSWPVVGGDELTTFAEPAMVKFDDGSSLLIDATSVVKLEQRNNKMAVVVLSGSADFLLGRKSELTIYAKQTLVTTPGRRSGTASVDGKRNHKQQPEERVKKWTNDTTQQTTKRSVSPYEP